MLRQIKVWTSKDAWPIDELSRRPHW
jgi:hypothetical protein